jgi:hypothetical protein
MRPSHFKMRLATWKRDSISALEDGAGAALKVGKAEAMRRSSGKVKRSVQRSARYQGAPFSKIKHSEPQLPSDIINEQTGLFKRSWQGQLVYPPGSGVRARNRVLLRNTAFYAVYLRDGTKFAFSRNYVDPVWDVAEKQGNDVARRRLGSALNRFQR